MIKWQCWYLIDFISLTNGFLSFIYRYYDAKEKAHFKFLWLHVATDKQNHYEKVKYIISKNGLKANQNLTMNLSFQWISMHASKSAQDLFENEYVII